MFRCFAILGFLGVVCLLGYFLFWRNVCIPITEKKQTLSGITLHFIDTNCDFLAKEEKAEIFVSQHDQKEMLIFAFDPEYGVAPSFRVARDGGMEISISHVSSIFYQSRRWQDRNITYKIGRIQYP